MDSGLPQGSQASPCHQIWKPIAGLVPPSREAEQSIGSVGGTSLARPHPCDEKGWEILHKSFSIVFPNLAFSNSNGIECKFWSGDRNSKGQGGELSIW
jgi:hypothetical protein